MYQPDEEVRLEVRMEDETVWLTQAQMVELFNSSKQNISLHISNIYKEGELSQNSTVKEYLTVQKEGRRTVKRKIICYNLDVIISVGYRVKSIRGTQFRQWANKVLKEYLISLCGHPCLRSRASSSTDRYSMPISSLQTTVPNAPAPEE